MSSTNRGAERRENDFYPTPTESVHALLDRVGHKLPIEREGGLPARWLEPAFGDGAIVSACHSRGLVPVWHAIDIRPEPKKAPPGAGLFWQKDYLSSCPDFTYDVIITNPPFSLAKEFIEKSLTGSTANSPGYGGVPGFKPVVIMLLRLAMLETVGRASWWQGREPDAIYVLGKRPDFTGSGGDSCAYGWFFWNWDEKGIFVLEPTAEYMAAQKNRKKSAPKSAPKSTGLVPPAEVAAGAAGKIGEDRPVEVSAV